MTHDTRRVKFRTVCAGVSANRVTPKTDTHVAKPQSGRLPEPLGHDSTGPMANRQPSS